MSDSLSPIFPGTLAGELSPRQTRTPKVIKVSVGNPDFVYTPNNITAAVGDTVSFQFYPTNHSVVRGEYIGSDACGPGGCNPCIPYDLIHPDKAGDAFSSGNVKTQSLPTGPGAVTFNLTINSTEPIWFYCTATESCSPNGMVGVINAAKDQSINKQIEAAKKSPFQLVPGQPWPAEGTRPGSETAPASANPNGNGTNSPVIINQDHGSHRSLSAGAIAGIAIGSAAVLLLAAALFFLLGRNRSYRDTIKRGQAGDGPDPNNRMSTVGDLGPWSPATQTPVPNVAGNWDPRFSGQTAYSHIGSPEPGNTAFIGYNRHTGLPEYAAEAGGLGVAEKKSPGSPPANHPAFGTTGQGTTGQETTYELPGEAPRVAEVPAGNQR